FGAVCTNNRLVELRNNLRLPKKRHNSHDQRATCRPFRSMRLERAALRCDRPRSQVRLSYRRTCVKFGYCARRSNSSRTHTVASRPSTLRPPLGSKTLKFGTELMLYCWQTGDSHSPMFTKWIARSSYFVLADSRTGPTLRQLPHQSA